MHISVHRSTTASPEDVWAVVTDLDGSPQTLSLVSAVRRLDAGDGVGVGTRWEETRTMGGKDTVQTIEVVRLDEANHRYEVMLHTMGQEYRSTISVQPEGEGSRVETTLESTATGMAAKMLARTLGKAFEGTMTKVLGRDLSDIVKAAEAR